MPKGEIVGNVVIDGKGIGKEGASETVTMKREKKSSNRISCVNICMHPDGIRDK